MSEQNTTATALVISDTVNEQDIAAFITRQYIDLNAATVTLVRRTVYFGATLAQAEIELDKRGLLSNRKNGQGMQAWLAKNCPDVNYKTAMRWKSIATKAANSLSCSSEAALKLLTGEDVDVPAKVTDRVEKIFGADSLRKLTQELFDFAADDRGSAGRPAGTVAHQPTEHYSQVESARMLWARPMSLISAQRKAFYDSAALLPIDDARQSLCELNELCSVLKKRISEGK